MDTKGHGNVATFCSRNISHKVQQVELLATWGQDKICTKLMLHDYNAISGYNGPCHCNINKGHVPATFSCVCTHCDFIPGTCLRYNTHVAYCVLHMILSLALVAAICPCKTIPRIIWHNFVPGTCLCYNTLLHVPLVCIACDFIVDTCRRNMSLHQNPSCLCTLRVWYQCLCRGLWNYPRANGAERRAGRKPGARVLIPPGYLHPGKRKH
jgi:hypothetical protein